MPFEKSLPAGTAFRQNEFCRTPLLRRALEFFRKFGEEIGAATPEFCAGRGVTLVISSDLQLRIPPRRGGFCRKSSPFKIIPWIGAIDGSSAARAFHTRAP